MAKSKITIHPLGPITVAGIAVLTWFLVKELGLFKGALPDMGFGQGIRDPYASQWSTSSDESAVPGTFVLPYYGNASHEHIPKDPVIYQNNRRIPWYQFLNEMFRSEDVAFVQERAYP